MHERVDLLELVPNNILTMSEKEFIEFAKSKFNLPVRSIVTSIKEVGIPYTYLCKLYNIRWRYINNSIVYNNVLVTQRFIADKFGFNELTIGRHRKRIGNDVERPNAVDIFLSVDMMNQGFHFEDLSGIVLEDKTASGIVYAQRIGRCMSVVNRKDMYVLDKSGNVDVEFAYRNKVAELFALEGDERQGHYWRDEERVTVHMSPKQRDVVEIVSKLQTQKQVAEAKNLAYLVKFYRKFPEKNVLLAGEAAGLSAYATLDYLDSIGILREEDKVNSSDVKLGITHSFRLLAKYKKTHNI